MGYSKDGALPGAKRDDAADGIVGRDADSDAVARHHLDSEPPHPAAELRQHFVAGVALHSVETARVNGHHRSLHVDQIVLAQIARPFFTRISNAVCHSGSGRASFRCMLPSGSSKSLRELQRPYRRLRPVRPARRSRRRAAPAARRTPRAPGQAAQTTSRSAGCGPRRRSAPGPPARPAATPIMPMPPRNGLMSPVAGPQALREDQDRPPAARQLADVLQRLARARLALRQRERVEEERRQVVVERVRQPLPPRVARREEVGLEELLGHGRRHARAHAGPAARPGSPARRSGSGGSRRTPPGPCRSLQVLAALDACVREHACERQNPDRLREPAHQPHGPAAVPRREVHRLVHRRRSRAWRATSALSCATLAACAKRDSSKRDLKASPRAPPSARRARAS